MKKLLSWFLILTALFSLAACGKKEPGAGQGQLEVLADIMTEPANSCTAAWKIPLSVASVGNG